MTDPLAHNPAKAVDTDARIGLCAAEGELSQSAREALERRYATVPPEAADVIVCLGGDGFMLEALHAYMGRQVPIFGMNRGTVGFLMNSYSSDGLRQRLANAQAVTLYPLRMHTRDLNGQSGQALAINEVSLFREERQAAKIQIVVDGVTRLEELICDGVLVATSAGSTSYNLSAHGPILPLGANVLALTPISAFRPRRWRGAILPEHARITFDILEASKRPVSAVADFTEIRDVARVDVHEDRNAGVTLLFDPEHNLEERVLKEQFAT